MVTTAQQRLESAGSRPSREAFPLGFYAIVAANLGVLILFFALDLTLYQLLTLPVRRCIAIFAAVGLAFVGALLLPIKLFWDFVGHRIERRSFEAQR